MLSPQLRVQTFLKCIYIVDIQILLKIPTFPEIRYMMDLGGNVSKMMDETFGSVAYIEDSI